jgi:hypothetical protein
MRNTKTNYLLIFIFISHSFSIFSQTNDDGDFAENRDSTWGMEYDFSDLDYRKVKLDELTKKLSIIRNYNDSMMTIVRNKNIKLRSDSLEQLYDLLNGDVSTSYNAYSVFGGMYHSKLNALNSGLVKAGLPKLKENSTHFTNFLDYTWKRKRFINDIFMIDGVAQEITKANLTVTYKFRSLLNYSFGYAIIDSKRFQFFPFGCLSFQTSSIKFSNSNETFIGFTSVNFDSLIYGSSFNTRGVEYELKKQELVLNYGVELDYHLFYSKRKTGIVIGARIANSQPLISNGWKYEGKTYSQLNGVNLKDYYVDFVIRIYSRLDGNRGTYDLKGNWWEE